MVLDDLMFGRNAKKSYHKNEPDQAAKSRAAKGKADPKPKAKGNCEQEGDTEPARKRLRRAK